MREKNVVFWHSLTLVSAFLSMLDQLDSLLSPNPFKRPHAVVALTIRSVTSGAFETFLIGHLRWLSFWRNAFSPLSCPIFGCRWETECGGDWKHSQEHLPLKQLRSLWVRRLPFSNAHFTQMVSRDLRSFLVRRLSSAVLLVAIQDYTLFTFSSFVPLSAFAAESLGAGTSSFSVWPSGHFGKKIRIKSLFRKKRRIKSLFRKKTKTRMVYWWTFSWWIMFWRALLCFLVSEMAGRDVSLQSLNQGEPVDGFEQGLEALVLLSFLCCYTVMACSRRTFSREKVVKRMRKKESVLNWKKLKVESFQRAPFDQFITW